MDEAIKCAQTLFQACTGVVPFFLGNNSRNDIERPFSIDISGIAVHRERDPHGLDGQFGGHLFLLQLLVGERSQQTGETSGRFSRIAGGANDLIIKRAWVISFPIDAHAWEPWIWS